MESFFTYLAQNDELRFGLLFGSLTFAIILENLIPLVRFEHHRIKHIGTNLVFLVTSGIVTGVLTAIAYGVFALNNLPYSIFSMLALPLWVQAVVGLLLLDFFGQYFSHACLHKFKPLWKTHLVHHSDTTVDASTGTRRHPCDILFRESLILIVIAAFGIPLGVYVLYRIITPFFAYFTHANIELPLNVDKALSLIIVTPNMHKFHHHFERPWTDTNFGNVLSCWDRMFGTFVYGDTKDIQYGVDTVDGSKDLDLRYQYLLPWNRSIKTDY
jgi:sterol desaturase/sphingolipid hydroxylase (fatty acid hydroxylase superfamily)